MNELEQHLNSLQEKVAAANANKPVFTLDELIKAVSEEIRMRHNVYPRLVAAGKKTPKTAERDIAAMSAVLNNLQNQKDSQVIPTGHHILGHRLLIEFHGLATPMRVNNVLNQVSALFPEDSHNG